MQGGDTNPQLSVIMTVYNRPDYLWGAIESVLGQSFSDFEMLIVEDGTTNEDVKTIVSKAAKQDGRVRAVRQSNMGLAGARNTGLAQARAPFVALMDDDDVSAKDRLWTQHAHLAANPGCAAVATGMMFIDKSGRQVGGTKRLDGPAESPANLGFEEYLQWVERVLVNPTSMIRRNALEKVGGYRPWFRAIEDIDLTLRLLEQGERLSTLPQQLYFHRTYRDASRLSQSGVHWDYYAAGVHSLHCRMAGLPDPVEQGVPVGEIHALLQGMPGSGRRHMIWKARSTMRKCLRDGDRESYKELWGKCRALVRDREDEQALRRLSKRLRLWKLRYLRPWGDG